MGVNIWIIRMLNYFQQAADAGNAVAMAFLGAVFRGGEAVGQNNETALNTQKAASLGNPVGQVRPRPHVLVWQGSH